ncbi:MAG TPA: hypothetical protein VFC78_23655, partial [Tepidisphaeraceae bacterium]|nr:hypothetical protein [Tepidisphaeraceae bacterium]
LEPALPLQTQCLETTPLPPILQRAFRGFHAYLMPISKIKLHCATISNALGWEYRISSIAAPSARARRSETPVIR